MIRDQAAAQQLSQPNRRNHPVRGDRKKVPEYVKMKSSIQRLFDEVSCIISEQPTLEGAGRIMRTKPPQTGPLARYGIALVAVVIAFVASCATWPVSSMMAWVYFFAAVMVSAWFGGLGPSLLATALLVVIGRYFFMKPYGTLTLRSESFLQILLFSSVSLFIGFLAARDAGPSVTNERRAGGSRRP